jgi:general secretion pathway protein C
MRDRFTQLWEQRRTKHPATVIIVIASVWLAWLLAKYVWLIFSGVSAPLVAPDLSLSLRVPPTVDARRIGTMFGEQEAAQSAVADTTLQLRLDGLLESQNAELSRAFISERGKASPEIYRPGDEVPGGAKIDRIEDSTVVLLRAGREEILRFDLPSQTGATTAAVVPNAAVARALRQMGMRRTSQGYIVSITAPKEILTRFGLKPGDRVVSINGQTVGKDVEADQKVLGQLQESGNARVEVQRGTQTLTLEQRL